MRRPRRPLAARAAAPVVAALVVALLAGSCGIAAEGTAATVGSRAIPTEQVDRLARSADFLRVFVGGQVPTATASTVRGADARAALLFEIQRAALLNEAERWQAEPTDRNRAEARQQVRQALRSPAGATVSPAVLERLTDFVAAQAALDARFAQIDPESEQDLRAIFDGAPALWDRTCVEVVLVPEGAVARAERLVRRGVPPERIAARIDGAQVLADPEESCLALEQLPPALKESVADAPRRRVTGPVVEADGSAYVFRVTGAEQLDFRTAREDLARLAESLASQGVGPWLGLNLLGRVDVNPRYGSGLVIGPTGNLEVAAPQAPAGVVALPDQLAP